jgi:hypothetical protein
MYVWTREGLGQPGPICQAAMEDVERLSDSLKWFNKEAAKTYANPQRLKSLGTLVLGNADQISGRLDDYIDGGCCEAELEALEAQVRALPWTFQRTRGHKVVRVEAYRDIQGAFRKVTQAIQAARRKARLNSNCSTP